jgi:hypothetical protein
MDFEVLGPEGSKFCRSRSNVLHQTWIFYREAPKRFLLSDEQFDRWALLHITSWRTPSMGFKIFTFLGKCKAPLTVSWIMAFLDVVPRM